MGESGKGRKPLSEMKTGKQIKYCQVFLWLEVENSSKGLLNLFITSSPLFVLSGQCGPAFLETAITKNELNSLISFPIRVKSGTLLKLGKISLKSCRVGLFRLH